jgi:hypothetical protein
VGNRLALLASRQKSFKGGALPMLEFALRPGVEIAAFTLEHATEQQLRIKSWGVADLGKSHRGLLQKFGNTHEKWLFASQGGQLIHLVFTDERFDHLVQLTRHHLVELVEGEVDAVIGDPPLGKIVGADTLGAVATTYQ